MSNNNNNNNNNKAKYATMTFQAKLAYYRTKSIMIMESFTEFNFNTCTPFVQFKFATRNDAKSNGNWDYNNTYWFRSYTDLYDLFLNLNYMITANTPDKATIKFSNPSKGKTMTIYKSVDTSGERPKTWYIVTLFNGKPEEGGSKIAVSLTEIELRGLVKYITTFIDNYPTIATMTAIRQELWFEFTGKKKISEDGGDQQQGYSGGSSGGGNRQGYSKGNQQGSGNGYSGSHQSYDDNMQGDLGSEFHDFGNIPQDDVPF